LRLLTYVGIDVAIAKKKRLPIAVCVRQANAIVPLALNARAAPKPPAGCGNRAIIDPEIRRQFATETRSYLREVERHFGVEIARIAIDAPSAPRVDNLELREAEAALAAAGISFIQTPDQQAFECMPDRAREHLAAGGTCATLPCANQLWMLFGFELFDVLASEGWECLEVYPQATVRTLGAGDAHKSQSGAVLAQLKATARHTGWPASPSLDDLDDIGYGSRDDRLDAYLAAWVASLGEHERRAFGRRPNDVIWVPKIAA
jgi:Protein of unknown function (DUF429)